MCYAIKYHVAYFNELVLLQGFTGDVQRQVVGINDTTDEVEIAWHNVLEVVRNEDTSDVELKWRFPGSD